MSGSDSVPSPPRSLDEAVNRIARALADDDGSGWWGEEECGPGHVDAARRLAEAGGLPELERENARLREALGEIAAHRATCSYAQSSGCGVAMEDAAKRALAQGAAALLPGDTDDGFETLTDDWYCSRCQQRLVTGQEVRSSDVGQLKHVECPAPLPGDRHE